MASQTIPFTGVRISINSYFWISSSQISDTAIDDALTPLNAGTRYITTLQVISAGGGSMAFRIGATATNDDDSGQDLSSAWETGGSLTVNYGTASATFVQGVDLDADSTEPYSYSMNASGLAKASAFTQAAAALATNLSGSIVLDDGQTPVVPDPVPPTVTISPIATGDSGTTATLGATIIGGTYQGSPTFAWTVSGGTLSDATAAEPVLTRPAVNADTTYTADLTLTVTGDGTTNADTPVTATAAQVSFTVQPALVESTQYAYRRPANAPSLPSPSGQKSTATVPNNWRATAFAATQARAVYRISRTIRTRSGTFVDATTNWAWDPSTQPGQPWLPKLIAPPVAPSATITAIPDGDEDTTVTLGVTVTGGTYQTGPTYAWTVSGGTLDDATLMEPVLTRPSVTSDTDYTADLQITVRGDGTSNQNTPATADAPQVTFKVLNVPVAGSSTQYAYLRSATDPTLPAPAGQRSASGVPSGWDATALTATTVLAVYRISRTIATSDGVFASASTDWAFDPSSQPWRNFRDSTSTEYAYILGATQPTLPTDTTEALPTNWLAANPGATQTQAVWRIKRTVTRKGTVFQSATAWAWDPASQPFALTLVAVATQHAYRKAGTLGQTTDLPASRTEALPTDWAASPQKPDADEGIWRISRTVTTRAGNFVSATSWGWDPAFAEQPYIDPASDNTRREVTVIRHKATGTKASVVWSIQSDVAQGKDGDVGRSAVSTSMDVSIITSSQPDADGEIRLLADTTAIGTLTRDTAETVDSIELGISADTDPPTATTTLRRAFFPQIEAGDLISVYENRNRNWVDYLVTAVPTSIAGTARAVTLSVSFLEWGSVAVRIAGACRVGFSRAPRGADGTPGTAGGGFEYIFASSPDGAEITGDANLPLATQNYDVDALRSSSGLVRGTQAYYDGTPPDHSVARPFQIRFRRRVQGFPARNEDIGSVEWVQDDAVRVVGERGAAGIKGTDGKDGAGEEYIFTSSATDAKVTGATNLPLGTMFYDAAALRTEAGLTRGAQKYWDGTPKDLSDTRPYQIRFRRMVSGSPAQNEDIGDVGWTQDDPVRLIGQDGDDGDDGDPGKDGISYEYIFTSSDSATAISGDANLPLASQNYDVDALRTAGGLVRGNQKYYDGTPKDHSATRPFQIRFRRKITGAPAQNADIGDVAWTQDDAIRVIGQDGEDGEDGTAVGVPGDPGVGVEYIFTASATSAKITGNANLPQSTQNYDIDALRTASGLVRGTQAYFDGTPVDLSKTKPFQIRFQRKVSGSPAQNEDIGDVPWTQGVAVRVVGQDGEDGGDGSGGIARLYRVTNGTVGGTVPALPSGDVTIDLGAGTATGAGSWSLTRPAYDPFRQVLWQIEAATASATISRTEWIRTVVYLEAYYDQIWIRVEGDDPPPKLADMDA